MVIRLILLAMIFAVTCVQAQEQDRGMMDRIMRPNMELGNDMGGKKFDGGGFATKQFKGGRAFGGVKDAQTKTFATRSFLGIKNPWFGNKIYQTQAAYDLKRYVLSDKSFESRSVKVKEARDAKKAARESDKAIETRGFLVKGKTQNALDLEKTEKQKKLSIDEVREILNRNR